MSVTVKAGWIGAGGAVVAALIGGLFVLFSQQPTSSVATGDINGNGNIVAGRDVTIGASPEEIAEAVIRKQQEKNKAHRALQDESNADTASLPGVWSWSCLRRR